MAQSVPQEVYDRIRSDPFGRLLGIELLEVRPGYSKTSLVITEDMLNFHGLPHGGVLFSLANAAFAAACNARGEMAVALNVHITYLKGVSVSTRLFAEATEESLGSRIGLYHMRVTTEEGELVAACHGVAYRREAVKKQGPP